MHPLHLPQGFGSPLWQLHVYWYGTPSLAPSFTIWGLESFARGAMIFIPMVLPMCVPRVSALDISFLKFGDASGKCFVSSALWPAAIMLIPLISARCAATEYIMAFLAGIVFSWASFRWGGLDSGLGQSSIISLMKGRFILISSEPSRLAIFSAAWVSLGFLLG